jgi:hypothetical protein
VEISKKDRDWEEDEVRRFSHKEADQFDEFGDEHPDELSKNSVELEVR